MTARHALLGFVGCGALAVLAWLAWPSSNAPVELPDLQRNAAIDPIDAEPAEPRGQADPRAAAPQPAASPTQPTVVVGRCLDAATRTPLGGITARLQGRPDGKTRRRDERDPSWQNLEATTEDDGRFRFACTLPDGYALSLDLKAPGRLTLDAMLRDVRPGSTHDLGDIPIPTGSRLRGRVLDETGQPVAGVKISLAVDSLPALQPFRVANSNSWSASSGRDGVLGFLAPVPTGRWPVRVEPPFTLDQPEHLVVPENQPELEVLFRLRDVRNLLTVAGRVEDELGRPVVGANLSVDGVFPVDQTQSDGSFRVRRNLEPPADGARLPVRVQASKPGYQQPAAIEAHWGDENLLFKLRPVSRTGLDLVVTEAASQQPVERFVLRFDQGGDHHEKQGPHSGGRVTLEGLHPGRIVVLVLPADPTLAPSSAAR